MSIILKESERLNKSIADFLRFVKPQEKRPAEFDIAASLAETLDLLDELRRAARRSQHRARHRSAVVHDRRRRRSDPPGVLEPRAQRRAGDAERRHADA